MRSALIVDDKRDTRLLLHSILQGSGYRVIEASHGAQALEVARCDPPDVVISDVEMPGMDGFELCREWMRDARLRRIPFVFYSAIYLEPVHQRFALELGARRYILKPEEPQSFLRQLAAVLAEQQQGGLAGGGEPSMTDEEFLEIRCLLGLSGAKTAPERAPAARPGAAATRRARALVVDDNHAGRRLLRAILEAGGYRVTEASDGLEAIKAAHHEPPDVVISDVLMPHLDGFSLCWHWMADPRLRDVPFVFYSAAFAEAEHERFAAALGAACFIPKPTEPEPFVEQLGQVLERHRAGTLWTEERVRMSEAEFRLRLALALGAGG